MAPAVRGRAARGVARPAARGSAPDDRADATVLAWAERRRRLHLHFTPTYASWLNQIEIWFRILTKAVIKDGVWRSKAQLVAQIMAYIDNYNATKAHPFQWTYAGLPLTASSANL